MTRWILGAILVTLAGAAWALDDANLVFYVPFEEGNGDQVADVSRTGAVGKIAGEVSWTTGKQGNALEFGGTGSVEFPDVAALDLTDAITLVGWIYPTATPADSNLWGRRTAANVGGYTMQWTNAMVETWIWLGGWVGTRGLQANKPALNAWHFVAAVYDGGDLLQYVDGTLDAKVKGGGAFGQVADVFRIGQAQTGLPSMPGIMDEIAVYDRALTKAELDDIEANGVLPLSVSPRGKLATRWGAVKRGALRDSSNLR